jgi:cytochrome P450
MLLLRRTAEGGAALPPGPALPTALQTLRFWNRPEPFLHGCRARYGDVFTVNVQPNGRLVFIADPALVKQVFTGPTDVFHAGEGNALLGTVLGDRSLLLLDEDEHLRTRRAMLPPFHGEHVRRLVAVMREEAEAEVARWPVGEPFALLPRFQALTLEVILRTVIGVRDEARLAPLRRLLPQVTDVKPWHLLMWVEPRLEHVGPWRRWRRLIAEADALLYAEIAERRRASDLAERADVLSMLVATDMDDRSLRDQLVTLLLAGHETTTTALAWAFERALRTPGVGERLHEHSDEELDAVVKETLRVRPVIDRVARRTTRPVELAGHRLPARTFVLPAIGVIQLDPANFPDPTAFRPERWLEDGGAGGAYTWLPFGGGPRRCLGATFAQVEMREVIRVVAERCVLEPADPAPERQRTRHITIVPEHGAEVVLTARR